jgi:ABC-type phosphate transport system auxiliary subunit
MNINKTAINDLKKNNEKISDLLSSLSDFKEKELDEILSKIEALKIEKTKPKIKKKESSIDIDKKIIKSISLTSKLFPKISKKSSIKISPYPMYKYG